MEELFLLEARSGAPGVRPQALSEQTGSDVILWCTLHKDIVLGLDDPRLQYHGQALPRGDPRWVWLPDVVVTVASSNGSLIPSAERS